MSNTIPNITIPAGVQSNVYALASAAAGSTIPVTSALRVTLLSEDAIRLCTKATAPVTGDGYVLLGGQGNFADTTPGEAGLFAFSPVRDALVNVQVLP